MMFTSFDRIDDMFIEENKIVFRDWFVFGVDWVRLWDVGRVSHRVSDFLSGVFETSKRFQLIG